MFDPLKVWPYEGPALEATRLRSFTLEHTHSEIYCLYAITVLVHTTIEFCVDVWSFWPFDPWRSRQLGYEVTRFHIWTYHSTICHLHDINETVHWIIELWYWYTNPWPFGLLRSRHSSSEVTRFHIWTQCIEICHLHAINATTRHSTALLC